MVDPSFETTFVEPKTDCLHNVIAKEEVSDKHGHIHLQTNYCKLCGRIFLVRTLGCNCKSKKKE